MRGDSCCGRTKKRGRKKKNTPETTGSKQGQNVFKVDREDRTEPLMVKRSHSAPDGLAGAAGPSVSQVRAKI